MTKAGITTAAGADIEAGPEASPWSRLRAIIDSLADGIVIVDRGGIIRFANPAAARLFNRPPEALLGTPLGSPIVAGETTEMEIVRRGGGEIVYAELRVVDTDWEGETVELVSLRDVTDRKYAEERARQLSHEREARLEAEAASRAKSDFLAIMSHELRTPLNAILGYSELMELGLSGELTEKMRDQIGRVRRSAKHLLSLVNDILDLAQVEAGRLSVANAPSPISDAMMSALSLIEPQAQARDLKLIVTPGAEALPPYIGDDERVRQILVNLLSNAVKCTEPGGTITLSASVTTTPDPRARLQPRGAHLCVTVTDTGSGISTDDLQAIFEPFVQAESGPTRTRGGSGLGLTIGQRLARAMGGDLTVKSTVGEGSSFSLWLPTDDPSGNWQSTDAAVDTSNTESGTRQRSRHTEPSRDLKGLCEVASGMMSELAAVVSVVVERIRSDSAIPMAAGLRTTQVADHLSTLIADIATALILIQEAGGEASPLLSDAIEVQRLVSERHGAQRARLGWTEAAMRREFMIVREELERVVHRYLPGDGAPNPADALAVIGRFVDQAEYLGVRSLGKLRQD